MMLLHVHSFLPPPFHVLWLECFFLVFAAFLDIQKVEYRHHEPQDHGDGKPSLRETGHHSFGKEDEAAQHDDSPDIAA
nr:hypothetical protein [Bifidobacterium catenulatum]